MSSGRRGGSDQNILEMLDRDSARTSRSGGRSRLAWYGAGGALAAGLIGLLAFLTHDSPPPQEAQPVAVAEVAPAAGHAGRADPPYDPTGIAELDDPPRPHHAAVVDEQTSRQGRSIMPAAMHTSAAGPAVASAQPGAGAVVQDDATAGQAENDGAAGATAAAATATTSLPDASRITSGAASQARPSAPSTPPALASADAARKPGARAAIAAPPSRAHAKAAPASERHRRKSARNPAGRKPAAATQPRRAVVDSDVALISAVLQHSGARGEAACADSSCAAKTTAQP